MKKIIYTDETSQRVDKHLAEKYPDFSRRYFQDGLKEGKILINGQKKSPSYKLKENDEIEIILSLKKPELITKLPPNEKVKIKIVAKYPDFLIIEKPAGLIVHPSVFDVQNNSLPPTLAGGLLVNFPELQKVGEDFTRPGIVHRLDKDTSGLMIIPRTQSAFLEFKKMFQQRKVTKTYLALCWNMQRQTTKIDRGNRKNYKIIDSFIGKSKADHTKQATAKNPDRLINPKEAKTAYRLLEKGQLPCLYRIGKLKKLGKEILLVEAMPKTGRKHQVRVHLSSVGLPLAGDHKYTSRLLKNCNKNFPHHLLHAYKLEFNYQGRKYSFASDPPEFVELIN